MIARDLRLRDPRDFEFVRTTGKSWTGSLVVMIVAQNTIGHNRYGVAAARRIGSAVRRNRAKRLLREAIRNFHLRIVPGHDIIFIARNSVDRDTKMQDIQECIGRLLEGGGLLTDDG